eukprot:TRINITY_DN35_c0_g1_i1.p1 TRINITY_DN35_c0_g1~~TRINITY_DN35_c0_g1_i1.p1  ORF type:complete len:177 (+),score=37.42 TRINITY_DN35_c0_g1_i1:102-632(+)
MVLPMPAMPMQIGGPTEFAKSKTPMLFTLLIFQTVVCMMRMLVLLDIMGGFIMGICIGLGWYAWKHDTNITFVCYWGMMGFFFGIMELVKFLDHYVKAPAPLFSKDLPLRYNLASFTILAVPGCMLCGAWLAYKLYRNYIDVSSGLLPFSSVSANAASAQTKYKAFAGSGQKLGTQ